MTEPDLNSNAGGPFIGMLLGTVLYGVTLAQILYYIGNYPRDKIGLKILVAAIWLLDTSKEMLLVQVEYYQLVQRHAVASTLFQFPSTYGAYNTLSVITSYVTQCFYVHAIWRLLANNRYQKLLTAAGIVLTCISLTGGLVFLVQTFKSSYVAPDYVGRASSISALTVIVTNLITDFYVAAALSGILRVVRGGFEQSTYQSSGNLISKLITYAVNRGLILFFMQLIELALFITDHVNNTDLVSIVYFPFGSLYINAMLVSLNARRHLSEITQPEIVTSFVAVPGPMDSMEARNTYQMHRIVPKPRTGEEGLPRF